jgi:hypothetical protein
MGVDFIKYDDIVPYPEEIEAVAEAIRKTGESVVLSLSPGGAVNPEDLSAFQKANMLRVTHDVWDEQHYIDECFKAWRKWQGKERPGFWIDMDMIPFGQLQLMSPPGDGATGDSDIALAGRGTTRWCQLIHPQMETFITMRALAASPLMVGGDLPSLDGYSLSLITNPEMIACNQNGVMGHLVSGADGIEVWAVEESDAGGWVGVFNRTPELFDGTLTPQFLGLDSEAYSLTDVWNKCDLTFSSMFTVDPNGVVFIRYKAR